MGRRTFLARLFAALTALLLPFRASASKRKHCVTAAPTLVDRLQSYSTDDTPFLPAYDAIYALANSSAVASLAATDSSVADALAVLASEFSGLRAVGFSVSGSSPVAVIAEPILISDVPSDPPGAHDRP